MIKLKDFPAFRSWCEKFKDGFGKVDLQSLLSNEKDSAVIAYCIDVGGAQYTIIAQEFHASRKSPKWKDMVYSLIENNMEDLCDQFNRAVDAKNAELADSFNVESYIERDESFVNARRIDQDMFDAGHTYKDFS